MSSWVNEKSNLVFMQVSGMEPLSLANGRRGDACHPMLPYLAQGANSAIEDGTVLGLLLGHIKTRDHISQALKMYENLRKTRGESIVRETFKQVTIVEYFVVYLIRANV